MFRQTKDLLDGPIMICFLSSLSDSRWLFEPRIPSWIESCLAKTLSTADLFVSKTISSGNLEVKEINYISVALIARTIVDLCRCTSANSSFVSDSFSGHRIF